MNVTEKHNSITLSAKSILNLTNEWLLHWQVCDYPASVRLKWRFSRPAHEIKTHVIACLCIPGGTLLYVIYYPCRECRLIILVVNQQHGIPMSLHNLSNFGNERYMQMYDGKNLNLLRSKQVWLDCSHGYVHNNIPLAISSRDSWDHIQGPGIRTR